MAAKPLTLLAAAGGVALLGRSLAPPLPPPPGSDAQVFAHRQAVMPYYMASILLVGAAVLPWALKGRR